MTKFKCLSCKSIFLEVDLIRTTVSENAVGPYLLEYCPKCLKEKRFVTLQELHEKR